MNCFQSFLIKCVNQIKAYRDLEIEAERFKDLQLRKFATEKIARFSEIIIDLNILQEQAKILFNTEKERNEYILENSEKVLVVME